MKVTYLYEGRSIASRQPPPDEGRVELLCSKGVTSEPERHSTVVPTEGTIENSETNVIIKNTTKTSRASKEVCEDVQSTHHRGEFGRQALGCVQVR